MAVATTRHVPPDRRIPDTLARDPQNPGPPVSGRLSVGCAIEMGRQLARYRPAWYEEPVTPDSLDLLKEAGDMDVRVRDMVEKPDPSVAPSRLAVIGRYVLPPAALVRSVPASTDGLSGPSFSRPGQTRAGRRLA